MKYYLQLFIIIFSLSSCKQGDVSTLSSEYAEVERSDFKFTIDSPGSAVLMNISTGLVDTDFLGTCNFEGEFTVTNNNIELLTSECIDESYSFTILSTVLVEGQNTIGLLYTYNNVDYTFAFSLEVDTITPIITIDSMSAISFANESNYLISGTCSEDSEIVTVDIDGIISTTKCSRKIWSNSYDVSSASEGASLVVVASYSDAAGNPAIDATTNVLKDTIRPIVTVTSASNITQANESNYMVVGSCTEDGRVVKISVGAINISSLCSSNSWTTGFLDVSGEADNTNMVITVDTTDVVLNSAVQVIATVDKTTSVPSVGISLAPDITQANETAWSASGSCSDSSQAVAIDMDGGALNFSVNCSSGAWLLLNKDVSSLSDSASISVQVDHLTAQVIDTIVKDTTAPTVTITSAPDISLGNQAIWQASGTCSENGRTVSIDVGTGSFTYAPSCSSGTWVTGLQDLSSLGDGTITITADHDNASAQSAAQFSLA